MSTEKTPTTAPVDAVVMRAVEIVEASEWSGDMRVNMTRAIGAGRVLAKRVHELTQFVEDLPCECHDEYGKAFVRPCDRCLLLGRDGRSA